MNDKFERRAFAFDVRAENDERHGNILTGRPIVYNSQTDISGLWSEIIDAGALNGANLKDVRFLVNHDTSKIPLARSRNNNENSTMQMSLDENGMSIRVNLDTENNADARALYSAVQRGDISGMSFAFRISGENWENLDSDYPTRHITAISDVFEVSAVTFPAYGDTEINARGVNALDSARAALDSEREKRAALDSVELEKLRAKYLYNIED